MKTPGPKRVLALVPTHLQARVALCTAAWFPVLSLPTFPYLRLTRSAFPRVLRFLVPLPVQRRQARRGVQGSRARPIISPTSGTRSRSAPTASATRTCAARNNVSTKSYAFHWWGCDGSYDGCFTCVVSTDQELGRDRRRFVFYDRGPRRGTFFGTSPLY